MKTHVCLIALVLLISGCDDPEPAATPAPTPVVTAKPVAKPVAPVAIDDSAVMMPEFTKYESPIYVLRNRPIFDNLVEFEQSLASIEPYLKPINPRIRVDWTYLVENTRSMDLALLEAMNTHLDTAINDSPKGGGEPALGQDFQIDLINLHDVARKLYWASQAQDLKTSRRWYRALAVILGKRPAVQTADGRVPANQASNDEPPLDTSVDDNLLKGKNENWGDLSKVKVRTNIRTEYTFWPAPVGTKEEWLSIDPKPKVFNWTYNMQSSPDFNTPQWAQPAIINTHDLKRENE